MNIRPFAKLLAKRPRTVLFVFTIITIFIGLQASNIYMESDFSEYLPQDDATIVLYNRILEEFQIGQTIIIYIDQSDWLEDIRDPVVLKQMDNICRYIYDKPLKEGKDPGILSIESLSEYIKEENAKPILQGGTGVNEIPDSKDEVIKYMERLKIQSMKGVLYTNAYNVTVIIIQLSSDGNFEEVLSRVEDAVNKYGNKETMTITGTVAMRKAIQKQSMSNLIIVFPVAIILVSIVLFFFHRTFKGIIIAFLPPAFAIALTFGFLGMIQPELTMISVAIVALLIGLGVDYSIHLMNRFAEERNIDNNIERVEKILKYTGKAVLLSTITTMIGFASLMISSMSPMITFGFGCAIGILFCFISSIIIVPTLVIILKFKKKDYMPNWKKLAAFILKHKNRIIFIAAFLAILSVIVLPEVKTDVSYLDMAPEGLPEVDAMYEYSNNFGTGSNFNALLMEFNKNAFLDSDVIDAICEMEAEMRKVVIDVFPDMDGKRLEKSVYSIADEINKISGMVNRSIILEKINELVGLEKILFDMISETSIVDEDLSKSIILISIPIGASIEQIDKIVEGINSIASSAILPQNGEVSNLTGQDAITVAVNNQLKDQQVRSMILALILVLAALIIIFSSSKYGFLTMIPVVFVLMWEPGFLVALDIPLSLFTITIASIMIGVGIDYGVHITHRFREELANGTPKAEAIRTSVERTGSSLVEAALTTIAGTGAIFFVNTPALNEFVAVVILMTALSCIAAALILPVFYSSKIVK